MKELIQGPVELWTPSDDDQKLIDRLLASDSELDNAYGEAYQNGCYIKEFGAVSGKNHEKDGWTAVGDLNVIEEISFRNGLIEEEDQLDPSEFTLGDCIDFGAVPCTGDTRAERVRDGVRQILEIRANS